MFCRRFQNRNGIGKTKNRAGRRKNKFGNIVHQAGFNERERRAGIILKIFRGMQHGFADFRKRREVHDRVETICGKKSGQAVAVASIANNQWNAVC